MLTYKLDRLTGPQALLPTPDTAGLKLLLPIISEMSKLTYDNSDPDMNAMIEQIVQLITAGTLLATALNKLESFGAAAGARVHKDKGYAVMTGIRSARVKLQVAANKLEDCKPTQTFGTEEGDVVAKGQLLELDPFSSFEKLLKNEIFDDCIAQRALNTTNNLKGLSDNIETALQGMQLGGSKYWRDGLGSANLEELQERADSTLRQQVDGTVLKQSVEKYIEARIHKMCRAGVNSHWLSCYLVTLSLWISGVISSKHHTHRNPHSMRHKKHPNKLINC